MAAFLGLFVVGIILGAFIMWAVSNLLSDAFQDRAAESEIRDVKKEKSRLERENKRLGKKSENLIDMLDDMRSNRTSEIMSARAEIRDENRLLKEQVELLKDRKVELDNALARTKLELMDAKEGK